MRRHRLAAAALVALTACGLPAEDRPRGIAALPTATPSADTRPDRPTQATVFLVQDGRVAGVRRVVPAPAGLAQRLDALLAGATAAEARAGLRTALPTGVGVATATAARGVAVLELPPELVEAGTEQQILALAQLVFTATELRTISSVRFQVEGEPVAVPRADGSLATEGVGRADYLTLLRR
jgi:spore germination protein GerM